MPRPSKGPRLYLRKGRRRPDGVTIPDVYCIRDGTVEIGTGCGPDRREGPGGADEQLALYILQKNASAIEQPTDREVERRRKSDPDQVYVAEVLAEYAAGPATRLSNPAKEASFIATLLPRWEGKVLSDVRRSSTQAYVETRILDPIKSYTKDPANAPRVSDQTARRELECLSTAIGKWHEEHHLRVVPKVVLPAKSESPRDALSRREAARLLWASMGWRWDEQATDPRTGAPGRWVRPSTNARTNRMHLRRFILISLYTGSRSGVTAAALWEESPAHPWANVDAGVMYRRARGQRDKRTKRRPVVKFPKRLQAHMERWRRLDEKAGVTAVIHFGGEPVLRVKKSFASCVSDAGLDTGVSPHYLRHTCATWLMERNVDTWDAAGFLGMSPTTLLKHYGHHRPDYQNDVADKFG
jgi:integrase